MLVTGASGGIGRAIALAFGERGCAVAVHYNTRQQEAEFIAQAIREKGGQALALQGDLTREADVEELFARMEAELGSADVLVNNAGTAWQGLLTDMSLAQWRQVLDADLTSVFLCCRRALPHMIRQ